MSKEKSSDQGKDKAAADSGEIIERYFAGCDDGHDSIKLEVVKLRIKDNVVMDQVVTRTIIPSKIHHGVGATGIGGDAASGVYSVGDKKFTVSDALQGDVIDTRSLNYPVSEENRVLVFHALLTAGLSGQEISLVTSLPVSDYYLGATPNTVLHERKRANLMNPEHPVQQFGGVVDMPVVNDHRIMSEGLSAIYDMMINEDTSDNVGFFNMLDQGPIGVIDVGGKTTDLAVINVVNGKPQVDMKRSGSAEIGMLRMQRLIEHELMNKFEIKNVSPRVMLDVLKNGKIMISGIEQDATDVVRKALNAVLPDFMGAIKSQWGNAKDMMQIIMVGGGSYTLFDDLKLIYPQLIRRDMPEFANARGMCKMAVRRYLLSNQQ